jgi:hypothetical protein
MNTWNLCPVRGNSSVENSVSGVCSAPIGAGDLFADMSFYRASAPNGACGSFPFSSFYLHFAPTGADDPFPISLYYRCSLSNGTMPCPVRGKISVERIMLDVCSAPIGAGGSSSNALFYRAIAPNGADDPFPLSLLYRCSLLNGTGDSFPFSSFYRYSAPNGTDNTY